jgi:hypothetical protein
LVPDFAESKHPQGPRFQGGFGIYDAPEPWGPWTTVFFTPDWDVGPGETSSFPTAWMSADGKTLHLMFSGDDSFSVRKAMLALREGQQFEWETACSGKYRFVVATDWMRFAMNWRRIIQGRFFSYADDKIVYEWYAADHSATKKHGAASMSKALIGGVSVAVALTDGLLALDDSVAKYVPQWRNDPLKSRITIRQLGSHTSGLDDAEEDGLPHDKLTVGKVILEATGATSRFIRFVARCCSRCVSRRAKRACIAILGSPCSTTPRRRRSRTDEIFVRCCTIV